MLLDFHIPLTLLKQNVLDSLCLPKGEVFI